MQDNCVLHCAKDHPTVIGENVTVGHVAMLEGCVIGDGALIGMGAIVFQRARVGICSLIAAGAVVGERTEIPPGVLARDDDAIRHARRALIPAELLERPTLDIAAAARWLNIPGGELHAAQTEYQAELIADWLLPPT